VAWATRQTPRSTAEQQCRALSTCEQLRSSLRESYTLPRLLLLKAVVQGQQLQLGPAGMRLALHRDPLCCGPQPLWLCSNQPSQASGRSS
jgi:hypothetical protein